MNGAKRKGGRPRSTPEHAAMMAVREAKRLAEWQVRVRVARKARGVCVRCEGKLSKAKTLCTACVAKLAANTKARHTAGRCSRCDTPRISGKWLCADHLATQAAVAAERRARLKMAVIEAYGSRCACCGETQHDFLTLDHIGGGGNWHRKRAVIASRFYGWIKDAGFPAGFQLLCWNCNAATRFGRRCPHQNGAPAVRDDGQALLFGVHACMTRSSRPNGDFDAEEHW